MYLAIPRPDILFLEHKNANRIYASVHVSRCFVQQLVLTKVVGLRRLLIISIIIIIIVIILNLIFIFIAAIGIPLDAFRDENAVGMATVGADLEAVLNDANGIGHVHGACLGRVPPPATHQARVIRQWN